MKDNKIQGPSAMTAKDISPDIKLRNVYAQ